MISRRIFVGGALAGLAQPAWAMPPDTSLRPMVRPTGLARRAIPSAAELIAEARLGGRVGFAVADARTGEMLEVVHPLFGMPPASVAKAITCAYGLDRLGPGYRFRTRLVADGPVQNGRLDGDLWLVGGGDPLLGTDQLSAMARSLRESGLREVTGRLMLASNALPYIRAIDPEQPAHVGYNPAISGLNLNFNRVHFEWARDGGDYSVQMDARSETLRPPVARMRMRVTRPSAPPTVTLPDGRLAMAAAAGCRFAAPIFTQARSFRSWPGQTGSCWPVLAKVLRHKTGRSLQNM